MVSVPKQKSVTTRKSANRPAQGSSQLVRELEPRGGAAAPAAPEAGPPETPESHRELYEQAIRAFNSGDFATAKSMFERAAMGPIPEMAHSARLHAKMCEKRLTRPEMSLRTPDEHYDYAVALMNERRFEQAERHLLLALAQTPDADHLFYALALCRGLSGDLQGAYVNLKRAIELQPQNRITAKNDPDFAEIGPQSPLNELIYSDSK
mgnify:CR=1 FL=1